MQLGAYLQGLFQDNIVKVKNNLSELRLEHSISQAELGKALKVSRQTINSIESGKYYPSLPLAFKIAEYFDLLIEEIFIPERKS